RSGSGKRSSTPERRGSSHQRSVGMMDVPEDDATDRALRASRLSARLHDLGRHDEALAAIEEAVALYRALADAQPEAAGPDLARSLGARGSALRAVGLHAEAVEASGEGLKLLTPHLQRQPQTFAPLCATLLQGHLQSLLAFGGEPDEAFLSPIVEILIERGVLQLGDPDEAGPSSASP
ncbi:MAG TPA: tetratricopeptide repeat protein, partial [Thalassobaculum sp.]